MRRDAAQTEARLLQTGTYVFALDVFDGNGEASCEPGRVQIEVVR